MSISSLRSISTADNYQKEDSMRVQISENFLISFLQLHLPQVLTHEKEEISMIVKYLEMTRDLSSELFLRNDMTSCLSRESFITSVRGRFLKTSTSW